MKTPTGAMTLSRFAPATRWRRRDAILVQWRSMTLQFINQN